MGKVKLKQEPREPLGIEKLMSNLEHASDETRRLPRDITIAIIRQILNEIPYASKVVSIQLAECLLSDAPHIQTNLALNQVVVNLGKSLCDPHQIDAIDLAVQTYIRDRQIQEKEYAALLLNEVIVAADLQLFADNIRPALRELAQIILEKIINEKQLRKAPGYRLQPLIEIIEPFLYKRLSSIELDRVKALQPLAFRKFVNSIAHNGYEKITDDKKLSQIHKEKETAFNVFKNLITEHLPHANSIKQFQEGMLYLQKDKNHWHALLKSQANELLKSIEPKIDDETLINDLKLRFNEKLRRNLYFSDQNPHIYNDEEAIKHAHEEAYHQVENDMVSAIKLISIVSSVDENYSKKFFQQFFGLSYLSSIKAALLDGLFGKVTLRIDPDTLEKQEIRMGGYLQKNLVDIYTYVIARLNNISDTVTGIYSIKLKDELIRALAELEIAKTEMSIVIPKVVQKPKIELPIVQPIDMTKPVTPILTEPAPKEELAPSLLDEQFDLEPTPVIEPPPIVKEEPVKEEPKPLEVGEFESELESEVQPISLEPVSKTEPAETGTLGQAAQASIDSGVRIMKNYQLGAFEKSVQQAWQTMVTASSDSASDDIQTGIGSDNEVRLYVICDLAQQVSAIQEANLSPEHKEALQNIKSKLIEALKNPLDEANWDYFEGTQRDIIDGALAAISS